MKSQELRDSWDGGMSIQCTQCLEGIYTERVYRVSVLLAAEISEWPQSNSVNMLSTAVLCDLVTGERNVVFPKTRERESI